MRTLSYGLGISTLLALNLWAAGGEQPPPEPASHLPPELRSGPDFAVKDPVESDGLMHHYLLESKFGEFSAYGQEALKIRVHEMAALTQLRKMNDVEVVADTVGQRVKTDAETVGEVMTHPVGTVTGIPKGIAHLFGGYKAQAADLIDKAKQSGGGGSDPQNTGARWAKEAKSDATKYADRYLGISAAERHCYEQLQVDPYTNNAVLRKTVTHLARVQASVNLGLHFVGVPGIPYLSDVKRAMDAIYNEDPAVLRDRQRKLLESYGLSKDEVARYENTLLLSPTRQALLAESAKALEGVAHRDELFRHAMTLTSELEVSVFIQSTRLLAHLHARRALLSIVSGLRIPAAQTADGGLIVAGDFDAVYWTEEVAGYEAALHEALPASPKSLELYLSGAVSDVARQELTSRGWTVHDHAWAALLAPSGT